MADQGLNDYSSTGNESGGRSNSVLELNVKTLDSHNYSFQVDKNITVLLFKEKIANEIGMPVGQQRLIFRGRVLNDDHPLSGYHLENGHTLHLVVRQPTQSGEANTNFGDNANDGAHPNRVGQISRGIFFRIPNAGDRADGAQPQSFPDSLDTLLEFINHMEETLRQNGYQQLDTSSPNTEGLPRADLPSNTRGLPRAEMLSLVMRSAQRLIGGRAFAALSHIAGRLEQDGTFSDPGIRGQVQSEATQVGLAMQQLGALLLELGRTLLALRMGQSPGESNVSVGRAVFISSSRPNPIMVQPFPPQSISLFGVGANAVPQSIPTAVGPTVVGTASRHTNIHTHAVTAFAPTVSAVGSQQHSSDGEHRDQDNNTRSTFRGPIQVIPIRNPVAAATPSPPISFAIFTPVQPGFGVSVSQAPSDSPSEFAGSAEFNARMRALVNILQANQGTESTEHHSLAGHSGANEVTERPNYITDSGGVGEFSDSLARDLPGTNDLQPLAGSNKESGNEEMRLPSDAKDASSCSMGGSSTYPIGKSTNMSKDSPDSVSRSGSSAPSRVVTDSIPFAQLSAVAIQQDSGNQVDVSSAVSQVLESPALDGQLASISEQTGVGSPNVLRNMFQQFTRNPQIMNPFQQIAQRVDGQEVENMFSGGQGGVGSSMDISRMLQQTMPMVESALGHGPTGPQSVPPAERPTAEQGYGERAIDRVPDDETFQVNVQPVVQIIESADSPADIFRDIVHTAADISSTRGFDLMEYSRMLRRDLQRRRQQEDSGL